jgi:hypothetical protein
MIKLTYIDKDKIVHVLWCQDIKEKRYYIKYLLRTNPNIVVIY